MVEVDAAGDGLADWSFARRFKRIYVHAVSHYPSKHSGRDSALDRHRPAGWSWWIVVEGNARMGRGVDFAVGCNRLESAQDAYAEHVAGSAAHRPAFSATASLRHPAAQQRSLPALVHGRDAAAMFSFSRVFSTARLFSTSAVAEAGYKLKSHSGAKKRWRSIASGVFKRVRLVLLDRAWCLFLTAVVVTT